jgi:hypothetical protein
MVYFRLMQVSGPRHTDKGVSRGGHSVVSLLGGSFNIATHQ